MNATTLKIPSKIPVEKKTTKTQQEEKLRLIQPGEIRLRIAPSPTGPMHLGFARTALFNYIFARKYQGRLVLRIEDTDRERSEEKWEKDIIEGLKWLGLHWDEGPDCSGPYGPYRQSERKEIYRKYIQKLVAEGKAYLCFCSPQDLEAHRQYLMSQGQPPRYSGKCRNLSQEEVKKRLKEKKPFVVRLKTSSEKIVFHDMLRGKIEYDSADFGDIVIAKDFSTPLFNLANVIDDSEMKITHVIRGEDHIPNTPKQILIAKALGIKSPHYLHLPLVLGPDKTKLSKRHGAFPISQYKKEGYLPEAIINFLALLGWNPGTEREIFSLNSLIQEFSIQRMHKSGAVFNPQKLEWINSFYIRNKSPEALAKLCVPYLIKAGLIERIKEEGGKTKFIIKETKEDIGFEYIVNVARVYQTRIKKLSDIQEGADFFFKKEILYEKELLKWKNMSEKEVKQNLDNLKKVLSKIDEEEWTQQKLEIVLLEQAEKAGDRGKVLWPLRVALTGKKASAGPFEVAAVLGKEKTLERIKKAIKKL